jgi:uncharacterized protein YbjT (DUF2867 family)
VILVSGATGRVGGNVVRMLRQADADVRCLVRMGSEYFWLNDTGASYFFGDLREPQSLKRAVEGCEFVVHVAGLRLETTENHHSVTTLQGTLNLIEAAKAEGVSRFVMVSCLGAGTGLPVASFDCLAKAESALKESGLSYTILRPAPLLDDLGALVRQAAEGKSPVFWAKGQGKVQPVTARDVAIYAMACLDHPSTQDSIVPLCGQETTTAQAILNEMESQASCEEGGVQTRNGWAASRAKSLAMGRRWANRIAEERALWDGELCVDSSAWLDALGIPLQSLKEGISSVLSEAHPSEDPVSRDTRVVHRQFQATVYTPGEIHQSELPDGPLRLI